MKNHPRVALFQANWPLQVHTKNAIKVLTEQGYDVDVFLYRVSQQFETFEDNTPKNTGNLRVLDFSDLHTKALQGNVQEKGKTSQKLSIRSFLHIWAPLYRFWERTRLSRRRMIDSFQDFFHINDIDFFPPGLFTLSKESMEKISYRALIGIERYGLAWAGHIAEELHIPLIYWSLELYTNDFPRFKNSRSFKRLKRLERKYHHNAKATMIQDADRAKVLLNDNKVKKQELLYVPVSLLGPHLIQKSNYLHQKLNIPPGKKIILAFGMIARFRLTHELVRYAQDFPEDLVLVVHGSCDDADYFEELQKINTHHHVIFSTNSVPPNEIGALVSSADVGLVIYSGDNANDLLIGRSSEKAALYAQAGVPMIAFDYSSFAGVFELYDCGRCISDFSSLGDQIRIILEDYLKYQLGAFKAYSEIYEFSKHFSQVIGWLDYH